MHVTKSAINLAITIALTVLCLHQAQAKLALASPEAQAKKAETTAKNAFGDKVLAYKLCLAQDRVAATYLKNKAATGTPVQPVAGLPACQDPGVYVPLAQAAAVPTTGPAPVVKDAVKK